MRRHGPVCWRHGRPWRTTSPVTAVRYSPTTSSPLGRIARLWILVLGTLCEGGGEVLVPRLYRSRETLIRAGLQPYDLVFEKRWHLHRQSIQRALTPRTRAILVGNPADPTGAQLSRDELGFLEHLCRSRGLALIADEWSLDLSLEPGLSVTAVTQCLALHLSGLGGICGLTQLEGEWIAVAGPEPEASSAASRLASFLDLESAVSRPGVLLTPPLLGRREPFLARLRARATRNRSSLAAASLREAPWTLQWGGGSWAVLQINPYRDGEDLCLALLEEGVAVQPGHLGGFPSRGYLLLSLLPQQEVFDAALAQIERLLRSSF